MSFDAMAMVVKVEDVSPVNKLILLLLANYADDKNQCYPSYETIAKLANCSKSTAIRSVNTLSELGLVSIKKRKLSNKDNQSNVYTVNDPQKAIRKDIEPSVKLTPASRTVTPPSVKQDILPSSTVTPPSRTVTPNTITINNHKETITKYKGVDISKFDEFWSIYPNKLRKKESKALWIKRKMDSQADMFIADVKNRLAKDTNWMKGQYIPSGHTYLLNDRWDDEIKVSNQDQSQKGTFANISDGTKFDIIWRSFERAGYQPNEVWAADGNSVQQWAIDAYGAGQIENKLLEMAK
jgi:hypothetical protein